MLWPDAADARSSKRGIAGHADATTFGPHTARLLRAARLTGIDARASRDAGAYLCNYLSWRAIENVRAGGPRLAAFIHLPLLARSGAVRRKGAARITLEELVDAGEAMLMELVELARQRQRGERRVAPCPIHPHSCNNVGTLPSLTTQTFNPTV